MANDKTKIEEGCYYHLYNRGNNRGIIFFEKCNYYYFLKQFEKYLTGSCKLHAYCLMPNHFHLFISVENKETFEKGIKNFFISYSKSINKKYDRVGSLCQGRYHAIEIKNDHYFTRIITYIHQNPLRAGMVTHLEDYKYSSYKEYIMNKKTFLTKNETLDWFGGQYNFIKEHKIIY